MITITIEAVDAGAAREEMRALLGQDRETAAPEQAEETQDKPSPEKPKATRSTKAKDKPASTAEHTTGGTTEEGSNEPASSAENQTSDGDEPTRDLGEKAMRERITQYSAKAGPIALTEMQKAAGAPNGKFSEIMGDPSLVAKLDALLADVGF